MAALSDRLTTVEANGGGGISLPTMAYSTKINDEIVNNSSVFQQDDVLGLSLVAGTWLIQGSVLYSSSAEADIRLAISGPLAVTAKLTYITPIPSSAGGPSANELLISATVVLEGVHIGGGLGVGVHTAAHITGQVVCTATSVLNLWWCQNATDPTDTVVYGESWFSATKVA